MMNSSMDNNTAVIAVVCHGFKVVSGFTHSKSLVAAAAFAVASSIILGAIAFVGNLLTLMSIWKASLYTNPMYLVIASLSVTDLLSSVTVLPLNAIIRLQDISSIHNCRMKLTFAAFATLLIGWSMITTCIVNLDRFIALQFPLRRRSWNLATIYVKIIASSWLPWLVYVIIRVLEVLPNRFFFLIQSTVIIFCIAFTFICQILIFRLMKRQRKIVSTLAPQQGRANMVNATNANRERRQFITVFIITFAFLVCYLPRFAVLLAIAKANPSFTLIYQGSRWSEIVLFANSAINPAIYAIRLPNIRRGILQILNSIRCK